MVTKIYTDMKQAVTELAEVSHLGPNQVLVVGCSTSEVMGAKIGTESTVEVAEAMYKALQEVQSTFGFDLAFQCCEHLNRAIVVERSVAERLGAEIVNAVPQKKAGGSMSTVAYEGGKDSVVVEFIRADAGIDIGDTFIGMHLKHVVVPVRLSIKEIGQAHVTAARVRPKSIGGARAVYNDELK